MTHHNHPSRVRLRVASALLLGTALTGAAHAETLTLRDVVTGGTDLYTLSIPSVEVTDGNLTEAEVRQLFQIDSPDDLQKWARISATALKIPEISFSYSVPATAGTQAVTETMTYRDLELRDVKDGVAGSTIVGSAEASSPTGFTMNFGRMTSGRFDIGALLAFYGIGGSAVAPSEEMKEVYADFAFEGGTFDVAGMLKCEFGAATAGKFLARPLKTSMGELQEIVLRMQAAESASPAEPPAPAPEDIKALVGYYTDLFTAFTSEPMRFDGFTCDGTDPTTAGSFKLSAGPLTVDRFEPGIYPPISLDNFAYEGDQATGFVRFGNLTWKRMDLNGPIRALEAAETLDEAWFAANWRKLVPVIDGLSVSGIGFDMPDPATPGQRTAGEAGLFDVSLAQYINGLPSQIALALDDAVLPLPPELAAGPAAAQLSARGISQITSDTHVKLHWDQATSSIVVEEMLTNADGLFSANLSGTLGNATDALFSTDDAAALAATQGLTVKNLQLDLENQGLYDMVLAITAAQGSQPLQSTRTAISGMVQGMTLAILGPDETSLAAAGEMGKFLSGANSRLSVTLTAKDGAGLTLADLQALEKDPTVLAGRVNVTAVASGDPVPELEAAPATPDTPSTQDGVTLQDQKRDLKAPAGQ